VVIYALVVKHGWLRPIRPRGGRRVQIYFGRGVRPREERWRVQIYFGRGRRY
jgi:hypothetical protein